MRNEMRVSCVVTEADIMSEALFFRKPKRNKK